MIPSKNPPRPNPKRIPAETGNCRSATAVAITAAPLGAHVALTCRVPLRQGAEIPVQYLEGIAFGAALPVVRNPSVRRAGTSPEQRAETGTASQAPGE